MTNRKTGLILINLGTPDSPRVADVRNYLNEFLMDSRVIDIPFFWRSILVKGLITPFRAFRSAEAYTAIWTPDGSPLLNLTKALTTLIGQNLNIPVTYAMRYGRPGMEQALKNLEKEGHELDEILIAPLYPHYAMSSYETAVEMATGFLKKNRPNVATKVLPPFYNDPGYIDSLTASIQPYLESEKFDAFLFSYHGLPIKHLKRSDATQVHCYSSDSCCEIKSSAWNTCYKHQVKTTTRLVSEKLGLDPGKVKIAFQSRLGSDKWIIPYTDEVLKELPSLGIKKVMVICPAFVTDCLETLEEMDIRGRELFLQNGGENFVRIPCLNTSPVWIKNFASFCKEHTTAQSHVWG